MGYADPGEGGPAGALGGTRGANGAHTGGSLISGNYNAIAALLYL